MELKNPLTLLAGGGDGYVDELNFVLIVLYSEGDSNLSHPGVIGEGIFESNKLGVDLNFSSREDIVGVSGLTHNVVVASIKATEMRI